MKQTTKKVTQLALLTLITLLQGYICYQVANVPTKDKEAVRQAKMTVEPNTEYYTNNSVDTLVYVVQ